MKSAWVFLALSSSLWAQSTAQIHGAIQDASGAAVPGAVVKATQTDTSAVRMAISDTSGTYALTNLPIGPYRLEISKSGFSTYVQTGIVLQVETQPTIHVSLKLGEVNEQVLVEAGAALVETQSTNMGSVIENQRILELPLDGRQATDLIQLTGAAVPQGWAGPGGFPNTGQIVIAGGQAFGAGFYLDGGLFNNPWDSANLPFPFPDALQEFKVETNALDAARGVHAGASINAATRSGTNTLHGDLFEFLRNNALNAQNFFTNASPNAAKDTLKRNQFGGVVGGRIIRDKLFFFAGYQNTQTRMLAVQPDAFVPTAAMQAGDFSGCPSAIPVGLAPDFINGKLAPGIRFDPASLKLARALPASPDPCGRTHFAYPTHVGEYQVVGRTDYNINRKESLFLRYLAVSYYRPPAYRLAPTNILTTGQAGLDDHMQSAMVGHTWTTTPNSVNSFRAEVNRVAINRGNADSYSGCDLGIRMYCGFVPHQSFFSVAGAFSVGSMLGTQAHSASTTYQLSDDFSLIRGAHQIGFGAIVSEYGLNIGSTVWAQNQYTFPNLAAFLLGGAPGNPLQVITSLPLDMHQRKWYFGSYIRDTWRLSPRLTLNAGIRYEPFLPPEATNGAAYNFNLADMIAGRKTTVYKNAPPGLTFPGDSGFPGLSGINRQWNLVAPRAGVAWDPSGKGQLAIRASYALAYDFNSGQLFVNSVASPPFQGTTAFPASSFSDPFASNPGADIFPYTVGPDAPFAQGGVFLPLRPDLHTTATHQWGLAVERQFGSSWLASAAYAGSETEHLWVTYQLNPAVIVPCPGGAPLATCNSMNNTNVRRLFTVNHYPSASLVGNMDQFDDGGTASYHGLILRLQKRLSRGVSASANYTWSHCIGDPGVGNSDGRPGQGLIIPNNRRQDRSNCVSQEVGGTFFSSDRRQIFNLTLVAEAPKFRNRLLRKAATGWQAAGIYRAQSAPWLTVSMSPPDIQLSGTTNQRPLQVLPDTLCSHPTSSCWINPTAFAVPALGTLSTMNRGNIPGPAFWQLALALSRNFRVTEHQRLQIRGEAFNVTNSFRAGVALPNPGAGSSGVSLALGSLNFGQITRALDARIVQLAIKYVF